MPYVKLDTDTLNSSLWVSDYRTRITFLTMLMLANPEGFVHAKAPGIARAAVLPIEDIRNALSELESPDPDSRSEEKNGRRIERVEGGYQVINYLKYRDKDHTHAERQRRYRERKRAERDASQSDSVTPCDASQSPNVTQAEAEAEAIKERVPYERIKAEYHDALPSLPQCRKLTPNRKTQIAARWREDMPSLEQWREYFALVAQCPFLLGSNDRGWKADLEWLTKQGNYAKVIEGRFCSAKKKAPTDLGEMTDGDY